MTDVPHFSLPLRFVTSQSATPQCAVNEQDSIDEIADCALATMLCPLGFRVELPSFGLPDMTFAMPRVDTDEVRTVIERWEPRAALRLTQEPDALDELIDRVQMIVQVRTQE